MPTVQIRAWTSDGGVGSYADTLDATTPAQAAVVHTAYPDCSAIPDDAVIVSATVHVIASLSTTSAAGWNPSTGLTSESSVSLWSPNLGISGTGYGQAPVSPVVNQEATNSASLDITSVATLEASLVGWRWTVNANGDDGGSHGTGSIAVTDFWLEVEYVGPIVTAIDPPTGDLDGGTAVTITGDHFALSNVTVTFGGAALTDVVVDDAQTIRGVTAAHVFGLVDVVVTNPDTIAGTLVDGFRYVSDDWIILNNAAESARVRREGSSVTIHDILNNAPNTARLTVQKRPGGSVPQGGSPLTVIDPAIAKVLFNGSLQTIDLTYDGDPTKGEYHWDVGAVDAIWRLNKYRPFGTYSGSASDVVVALVADWAPSFTTNHVQTTLAPITITCDGSQTMSEVLTTICGLLGSGHWKIDDDGIDLHLWHVIPPAVPALDLPPAPLTAVTLSEGAGPFSVTPGLLCMACSYVYTDGAVSGYGPLSNALAEYAHVWQVDDLPIGDPDLTHGDVVARLLNYVFISNNFGPASNPALLTRRFLRVDDNSTTSVVIDIAALTPPAWTNPPYTPGVFPPYVSPLPDGPTPAPIVAVEHFTDSPVRPPIVAQPETGTGDIDPFEGPWVYIYTYSAAATNTDHSQESVPGAWAVANTTSGRLNVYILRDPAIDETGILWVFCYRAPQGAVLRFELITPEAQPFVPPTDRATWEAAGYPAQTVAQFTDDAAQADIGPLWSRGNADVYVFTEGISGLTYAFALSAVYDNGVESLPGPWTDPIAAEAQYGGGPFGGGPIRKFHFSDVPVADDFTDELSVAHPCVFRKLYARMSYVNAVSGLTVVNALLGWLIIPDNTTTDVNDDLRHFNEVMPGFFGTPLPTNPRVDGPDLEADDPPPAITTANAREFLLDDPAITLSEDDSQIRTRVFGRGAGSTTSGAALAATAIALADVSLFESGGGQAIIGPHTIVSYSGLSGSSLLLTAALAAAVPFGTVVSLWVQRDDLAAQADLGAVELDDDGEPTDGIHEYTITDTSLRSVAALIVRCDAELALFSRPIRTVKYGTRDRRHVSGQQVSFDLAEPAIVGTFTIQSVDIDQVQINGTLVARRTVTAGSVRFTLDDLLQRVLLSGAGGTGTGGGSAGAATVVTSTGGGGAWRADLGGQEGTPRLSASWGIVAGARPHKFTAAELRQVITEIVFSSRTDAAATSVQLRLRNTDDATTAATSTASTSTAVVTETKSVTLIPDKWYQLESLGGNAEAGVYGWGYLKARPVA